MAASGYAQPADPPAASAAPPAAPAPATPPATPAPAAPPATPAPATPAPAVPASPPAAEGPTAPTAPPAAHPVPDEPTGPVDDDGGSSFRVPRLQIHGFASEGGFVSTANDYIGLSSRGSLALFEAGINVSTEVSDRLCVGIQLYGRDYGFYRDLPPRLDWAFLDYRYKPWLGLRAGVIKMPYGLYNEYADIDSSRTSVLLPQSVYPVRNRSALLAHTGFAIYGNRAIGEAGALEYQAWLGTLAIPENALVLAGATLDSVDAKYVTGAQLFWRPPIDGLRVGATFIRNSIDFQLTLSPANIEALIMAGVVPADFQGDLRISQRPNTWWIGSVEYTRGDWLFAGEYSRTYNRQVSSLPAVLPTTHEDTERFYAMVTRRFSPQIELGAYYSHLYKDPSDRGGHDMTKFAKRFYAFQRDAAATLRYDVTEQWLWKLEAHFIDGAADLDGTRNPDPTRYWGLFLLKTTVTF